ncbi:MAG: hypothetical protein ACI8RZ_001965 [Myxococcota bacterium]
MRILAAAAVLAMAGTSCAKVPIFDVAAGFTLADAAWFAEEETLFVFYEAAAEQGIGDPTVIEITYATDEERIPWTIISDLPTVHTHLDIDCGIDARCGSTSLHVPLEPREVQIRLRYHRDGELALEPDTVFNVVDVGDPHSHRSLIVYGVFDETNQRVQWRGRHQFPTVRNQQAEELGLRRLIQVEEQTYGTADLATDDNPYGYGVDCPGGFTDADLSLTETSDRAVFNDDDLPIEASPVSMVCAQATVEDATGTFTTGAIARKNPEVRPAFPTLRSPIHDANILPFFLAPCNRIISDEHEQMQRQRLQMEDVQTTCIDNWASDGFADSLAELFSNAIEANRPDGEDMVLVIGLHHDDEDGASEMLEDALVQVLPEERHRSTPRVAGAFVFDSYARQLTLPELGTSALWCPASLPANFDLKDLISAASLNCAILADNPSVELGPLSFGGLPILTSREQYLEFIDDYSDAQAGTVQSLSYRTPEFAVTSDHIDFGDYGVVTFLNNELISAAPTDSFSYCVGDETQYYVFRSAFMQTDIFAQLIEEKCDQLGVGDDFCETASLGLLPLSFINDWHSLFAEDTYELGIFWDFPFLLQMEYETVAAGSATAFGLSVPFGIASDAETYYGSVMWETGEFSLAETLTQCRRFCDHPTFDSAGVYHVTDSFRTAYATSCYQPDYPVPGDSGFPRDP